MSDKQSVELKDSKLRHAEYYGMTDIFDSLYLKSSENANFKNLMQYVILDDNLLLAYRNIKRNKGSYTAGIDKQTIKDVEKLSTDEYLTIMKKRFAWYQPRKVKRVDIPKPNGKTRPLGIGSIWDRLAQQSILQVLEPICESKFSEHSYGFRPNRSVEQAIVACGNRINFNQCQFVVDVDIKGFFDEVCHSKLMKQLWTLGIRDKKLLAIIGKMLKSPIKMPNGKVVIPTKGTPQGAVLSPLLANINLNEFDWWMSNQWQDRRCKEIVNQYAKGKGEVKSNHYRKLRSSTSLKEFYYVRYADDFKILCKDKDTAERIFNASKLWLEDRLRLPISTEKSTITELQSERSTFLGFEIKAEKKGERYVMHTHVSQKAIESIRFQIKNQIRAIQKSPNSNQTAVEISRYNALVIGIHNYYEIASHVATDINGIHYSTIKSMKTRLHGLSKSGEFKTKDKGIQRYMKSRKMRFLCGCPIIPIGYVKHRRPIGKKKSVCKYSSAGRSEIHKNQTLVSEYVLQWLRKNPIINEKATIEYNDNRISKFVAQHGKCAISGRELLLDEIHCHHITPYHVSKDDKYNNLAIVHNDIHKLIHTNEPKLFNSISSSFDLSQSQLDKLNKFRVKVGNKVF
ncbi:group II intron reverse transcriptase/maturase [Lysinibacillus xylanilyticus]|uniref:group II intron reverse transcriptase/maturase n=1 Tax=Lysinibacillus xylanilyticus TaxID=582475 RepID=UPI002B2486B8|nr:group II intron reverse transcriptase/maturase [Lysinibacillus xylanilyticus]MEB2301132.1 group II intron reverse transcriptase/maturase [Lysinibacillus xylanilyticus]